MFFVLSTIIGVTIAAPASSSTVGKWSDMIKNANEVRNEISSLSEPEQDAVMTVIQILGNTTLTDDQKRDTINKMIAEAPTDVQKKVQQMTDNSLKFYEWLSTRLQNVDPSVQTAIKKMTSLMMNKSFILSSDSDKESQLNSIVTGMSQTNMDEMMKIDQESKAKEKEIGLDSK